MLVLITMMFNLQSQQWCQLKIFTKLKYVAADGAGCFVACIDPLDQTCGVKFLLTFETTLPRDLKI
jgi:hypothetical protein